MPHDSTGNYQYPDANFKTLHVYLSLNFPSSSMVMWSDSGHPHWKITETTTAACL